MSELRRSHPSEPGIGRRRRGRGFSYHHPNGRPVRDRRTLRRIKSLAIPPAWTDVWICASPDGHLQAVGTDAAGRRQYRYHDLWRSEQDRLKFERVADMATRLPEFRDRVAGDLATRGLNRRRVLAAAARMLELGLFRAGSEEYDAIGLATLRAEHVSCTKDGLVCRYAAKGGKPQVTRVRDPEVRKVVAGLLRDRREGELLRYRDGSGQWTDVRAEDVNDYLRDTMDCEVSAKDLRTWHATVLAAVGLSVSRRARTRVGRRRAVRRVMGEVAHYLGNTPAVARASYVDPRVIDAYEQGRVIPLDGLAAREPGTHGRVEQSVVALLNGDQTSVAARSS